MTIDSEHKVIVFKSCHDKALLKQWNNILDQLYMKETIVAILKKIHTAFPDYKMRFSNEPWPFNLKEIVKRGSQSKKQNLIENVAKIFAMEENRRIWPMCLSGGEKMMWEKTLSNIYISESQIKKLTGRDPFITDRATYYSKKFPDDFMCMFGCFRMGGWYESSFYFFLSVFIRDAFENLFGYDRVRPDFTDSPDKPEHNMQLECETLTLIPIIKNLWLKGQIEMGRFKITASAVNRAAKLAKMKEFVTEPGDSNARNLRASLLLNAFTIHADAVGSQGLNKNIEPQDFLKEMVAYLKANTSSLCGPLLSFLDKSTVRLYEGNTLWVIWNNVTGYICSRPAGDWITVDELCDNLYRISEINNNLRVVSLAYIDTTYVCNARNGYSISPSNLIENVTVPAMLSIVALLASLGLVEIVYKTASPESSSALSGLRRLRLTQLGEYVFGLKKTYSFTPLDKDKFFELADDRLLIRALDENNPYEGLLAQFAAPIGSRRYIVTPASFLDECRDWNDIKNKVHSFRQMVCANPPAIWEDFFKKLLSRTNIFTDEKGVYEVFHISPEATELHELLVTDPELRKCVLRAEDYHLLVPVQKLKRLKELLRKAGYLL